MTAARLKLLIVDDESSLRTSLAAILGRVGYDVRCAEDGFTALAEIRRDRPDLILSDLNMPGMSGFELLSVVCRKYPAIRAVAMSGAYKSGDMPPGVPADAFYAKGTNLTWLLNTLENLAVLDSAGQEPRASVRAPLWISMNSERLEEVSAITLCCQDCLRTFSIMLDVSMQLIREARCVHCSATVCYAVVEPSPPALPVGVRPRAAHRM